MKKLIKRKPNTIYVKIDKKSAYCDFCGEENVEVFESEFESGVHCEKSDMQICFNCVKQLHKLI